MNALAGARVAFFRAIVNRGPARTGEKINPSHINLHH